jgi:hypothetical protein
MTKTEESDLTDEVKGQLRDDLRRFWSRLVYFLGMMVGLLPLITLPANLFMITSSNPAGVAFAEAFNALTILPASALAYWQRSIASWWLIVDAAVGIFAGVQHPVHGTGNWVLFVLTAGIPLFLGGFGLITGWMGWPSLLERKRTASAN